MNTAAILAPPAPATAAASRISLTLLTGFLGSGKTTLLRALLRQPGMRGTAVIINEFGEVGLDHELVEAIDGETLLLQGGCVCCTVRDDLTDTLMSLLQRAADGLIAPLTRVVIETTGLADPVPLMQVLGRHPGTANAFVLDRVITTLDAVHGGAQLDAHPEAVRQVAMADRVVITKTDLAGFWVPTQLKARISRLQANVDVVTASSGDIDVEVLFAPSHFGERQAAMLPSLLCDGEGCMLEGCHPIGEDAITSHSLLFERPLDWDEVSDWLASLAYFHGDRLLRMKGILHLADSACPVAVHGVRDVVYPPVDLAQWPTSDRCSRLVFITQGLDRAALMPPFGGTAPTQSA